MGGKSYIIVVNIVTVIVKKEVNCVVPILIPLYFQPSAFGAIKIANGHVFVETTFKNKSKIDVLLAYVQHYYPEVSNDCHFITITCNYITITMFNSFFLIVMY